VVVLAVLVGVSIALTNSHGSKPGNAQHAAASPSSSPTGPPVSPEAYQQALDNFTKALGNGFAGLDGAHTPDAVRQALSTLQSALTSGLYPLKGLFPPDAVRSVHLGLITQLSALNDMIIETMSATSSREICGGSSASSRIARSVAAEGFRTAIQALSTADPAHAYKLAPFLPASAPDANRQLNNGNFIKKPGRGPNTVKVENKFDADLVISLAPAGSKTATLMMYVRAGQTASATSVPDGNYDTYMAKGTDWDPGAKAFTRDCVYEQFSKPSQLTSTSRTYAILTFTLGLKDGSGDLSGTDTDPGSLPT
jgi:hypothetical protein